MQYYNRIASEIRERTDYMDFLHNEGLTTVDKELLEVAKNAIPIIEDKEYNGEIAIGSSKLGGYPDLPPEINYPTLCGYTENRGNKTIHYEETAMQLIAQINLTEVAEFDKDNVLPKSGILWIFWSGELDLSDSKYATYSFEGDNKEIYKILYYDGDINNLRRTKPTIPYSSKNFDGTLEEIKIKFEYSKNEYNIEFLEEELGDLYDYYVGNYDVMSNKLLGYPTGSMNISGPNKGYINLLQYNYHVGFIWDVYWYISEDDLKARDFSKVIMDFDLD